MKKTILFILSLLFIGLHSKGQAIFTSGTPSQVTNFRGGIMVDSVLKLPVRGLNNIYPLVGYAGRIQVSSIDQTLNYHNGTSWFPLMTVPRATDSINAINSRVALKAPMTRTITINGSTWDMSANRTFNVGTLTASDTVGKWKGISYAPAWTSITGKPSFATVATSGSYSDLSGTPTIPAAQIQSDWNQVSSGALDFIKNKPAIPSSLTAGTGISIVSSVVNNTAPDQTVSLTAGNRISITGSYPNFTIAYIEPTINAATRAVNTNYTISTTKQAIVLYSLTCSATNPLLAGSSSATAFLEYSLNAGSTWVPVTSSGNSNAVALAVSIQLTNGQTGVIGGAIPANALVRIRSVVSGTGSVGSAVGQEIY